MSGNQLLNGYANGITPNGIGLGEVAFVRWLVCRKPFCQTRVSSSRECLAQMFNQGTKENFNKNRREGKKICLVITEANQK